MFYILYGPDDLHRHQALEKVKRSLGDPDMLAVNTFLLDGHQLTLAQLKESCSVYPSMLCPSRLVIVEGLLKRFEPAKSKQSSRASSSRSKANVELEEWRGLGDYVKHMPPTTHLVLIDGDVNEKGRNPLFKELAPLAQVAVFPRLKGRELANWVREQVGEQGGTITPGAVDLLVDFVGGDLWAMSNELDKLLTRCPRRHITEHDVRELTSYTRETNVFAFVDAAIEGQRQTAQKMLHRLLGDGEAPTYLLFMLTRQLRLIVSAKELSPRLSQVQIREQLKLAPNAPVDRLLSQAAKYNPERIRKAYQKVLEADLASKTGKYDGDTALDLLVIELSQI